jgi:hypothetical protein
MYTVGQVSYILPHRVLVRGSVGVAYWSGVRPCTGQGLRRGSRTGQGSDRVLVRGSVEGHVLVRGRITRQCVYIYIFVMYVYIYTHRVLVRGSVGFTYWSGVRSCTGQCLRKGSCTGQGSDRVLVKGSGGVVYWSGVVFMLYTHTHTHTHTYTGVFFFLHGYIH